MSTRNLRALVCGIGVTLLMTLVACEDEATAECKERDNTGPAPSCEAVCAHLFDIECHSGASVTECTTVCSSSPEVTTYPEVMHCYQAAADCDDVNACSRGCGPDNTPVPFAPMYGNDAATD